MSPQDPSNPSETGAPSNGRGPHLWEIRAAREALLILGILVGVGLIWYLRPIVIPVVVAFLLAYLVDPIVTGLQRRWQLPRMALSVVLLIVVVALGVALGVWAVPQLAEQLNELVERLPAYLETLSERYDLSFDVESLREDLASRLKLNPQSALRGLVTGSARVFGFVGTVIGATAYVVTAALLVTVLFVFFSARFDQLSKWDRLVPERHRKTAQNIVRGVDQAFSGYIRGQLVVAVFTMTGFCVGFWLIGVPYWFVTSLVGGVLSLIPYGQCSGWILAIVLKFLETQTGDSGATFSYWSVLLQPSLVYAVTQTGETWLITPIAQGQATRLHPVTIILALLTGGFVAGVAGLVLAIPVTASLKVFGRELILPRLKKSI